MTTARPRFRPSYGAIPTEAIVQLVSVGVQAGSAIASTAITSSAQKKMALSQQSHARKMAALEQKRAKLEARMAEAQERATQKTAKRKAAAADTTESVPTWALGLGAAVILGLGGVFIYRSRKKAPRPEEVQ